MRYRHSPATVSGGGAALRQPADKSDYPPCADTDNLREKGECAGAAPLRPLLLYLLSKVEDFVCAIYKPLPRRER